ncbi:MAG: extracellular solute-binding protein, partial [Armatimonadetes bacterium]|nr:extracellular solute-binding protein [Armatimonadota bacterium]
MKRPVPTGIPGVDEIIGGGFVPGSSVLVEGVPGAGKTTFGLQTIVAQAKEGRRCILVSFEQLPGQILADAASFGWDLEKLEREGLVRVICTSPELFVEQLRSREGPLGEELTSREVDLVVIDSVSHIYEYRPEAHGNRAVVYSLISGLKRAGVTTILTKEMPSADPLAVSFEEYLTDVVLRMTYEAVGTARRARYIEVLKTRGLPHLSGKHALEITQRGLVAYPRMQPVVVEQGKQEVSLSDRASTGALGLDEMTGGGIPRGFSVLVAGSAGVGKTTLALSFACAGARAGEPCLYLSFDEPPAKLIALADALGLELGRYVSDGVVEILHVRPLELNWDVLMHRLGALMDELPARRFVMDSVTDLEMFADDADAVREFVYCAIEHARLRGATTMLTSEVPELFGPTAVTAQHISIIVDCIILLKYVEMESAIERSVAVLKMRGSDHDKSIRRFTIGPGGVHVLGRFEGAHGVLAGEPRLIPITLAVRSFTEFDDRLNEELLNRFAQLHPNVQPVPLTLPYNPDEARMTIERVLSAAQTALSAVPLCMYWMPQIIDPEKLQPLDELCPNREEHLPDMIEAATVGGRLYAVPAIAVCGVLLYRRDLLEKHGFTDPPSTWDELILQARTVVEREGDPELWGYVFPGYMYEGLSSTFLQNLWSNGGDVIDAEGNVVLDSEAGLEAARYMHDLVH